MTDEKRLNAMEQTLDKLVGVASQLKELSKGSFVPDQLEGLQNRQEELVAKLCEQDSWLRDGNGSEHLKSSVVWARVKDKMDAFHELNEAFVHNLTIRKALIQFEFQQVRQTRKALEQVRGGYGAKQGTGKVGVPRNSRINTAG